MTCTAKHTKYQPSEEEWKCPTCGVGAPTFFDDILASEIGASEDCSLLHADAVLVCEKCTKNGQGRVDWAGTQFARLVQKKTTRVKCECCKGTGWVDKVKEKTS